MNKLSLSLISNQENDLSHYFVNSYVALKDKISSEFSWFKSNYQNIKIILGFNFKKKVVEI